MDLPIVSLEELVDLQRRGKLPPPRHLPDEYRHGVKTVHGPAVAEWHGFGACEQPRLVRRAAFEGGRRLDVEISIAGPRRQSTPPMLWVYGDLDIQPDDIRFTDLPEQPVLAPVDADEDGALVYDLARNAAFISAVQDDLVAGTAFVMLAYVETFIYTADPRKRDATSSGAISHMLAVVRGRGENHLDVEFELQDLVMHLPCGDSLFESAKAEIRAIIGSMGWESVSSS